MLDDQNLGRSTVKNLPWVKIAISAGATLLMLVALIVPERVGTTVVILLAFAILPWANTFLKSLEIGASGLKAELNELKRDVEGIADANSDPETSEIDHATADGVHTISAKELSEDQRNILGALINSKYTLRSISGIVKETNISRLAVENKLSQLADEEYVNRIHGRKGIRWGISPEGRRVLQSK